MGHTKYITHQAKNILDNTKLNGHENVPQNIDLQKDLEGMGHTKYITHQAKYILDRKFKDIFNKIIQSSMDMSTILTFKKTTRGWVIQNI